MNEETVAFVWVILRETRVMPETTEISNRADIERLVDVFYTAVLKDEMLAPFFTHLNFVEHLPKMVHFWSFVLLDEPGYTTNVTERHSGMKLTKALFDRWIQLFHETVDSMFEGEKARLAKERATLLGWTMAAKHTGD